VYGREIPFDPPVDGISAPPIASLPLDTFTRQLASFFHQVCFPGLYLYLKNDIGDDYADSSVRSLFGSLLVFVKTRTGMAIPLHGNLPAILDLKLKNLAVSGKERMNGIKLMALLGEFNICLLLLMISLFHDFFVL
jgi:hypothetical protein